MPKSVFIFRGSQYAIASIGNGWAYQIQDVTTNESVWLQDDDASAFRARVDKLEAAFPELGFDALFARAIDGYSA